jgi:phosphoribosylaminoimidazole-succinocarboxamide synthase
MTACLKFLRSGKVKDIYELPDGNILFHFSDRVSAFDVKFSTPIPKKGEVLCRFAEYWFKKLPIKNHYVRTEGKDRIVVKPLQMIPIECVVRGYFYGSIVQRWKDGQVKLPNDAPTQLAAKLSEPIFDPTTKSATHDVPISKKDALDGNLLSQSDYEWLENNSIEIYRQMFKTASEAGFVLADLKLEFGKIGGDIVLGDSIGPDEYRLWPHESYQVGKIQESFDKQLLRDWLSSHGYQKEFEDARNLGKEPIAPQLPESLCLELSSRYITAYEKITGIKF